MPKISQEKKNQRQEMILAAAFKLFSKKGYYPTSMDDITKEAGVSKGLIYTYFKSKEEIGPKGLAVRQLKRYVSWVQNVARQFGPYLLRAEDV